MTPEKLAEWREDAELRANRADSHLVFANRIIALIGTLEDMTREARLSREATERAVRSRDEWERIAGERFASANLLHAKWQDVEQDREALVEKWEAEARADYRVGEPYTTSHCRDVRAALPPTATAADKDA